MLPLTWLYVPGDRPDRFESAARSGADVVVIDWEDAVCGAAKAQARTQTLEWLESRPTAVVEIRINAFSSAAAEADLAAIAAAPVAPASVRIPKVTSAAQVLSVAAAVPDSVMLVPLLESAHGVENAYEIASATERVRRISLGEADLAADLALTDSSGLDWCRGRLVVAARAAGLEPPPMSVWTAIADDEGLRASCLVGRAQGFLGRAAIHPRQVPVIVAAFRPGPDEVAAAREVCAAFGRSRAQGSGVVADATGRMIDAAVVRSAQRTLELAASAPDRAASRIE